MKKILALIFAVVAFGLVAYSQNDEAWKVTEFKMMPTDMDAKVDYAVKDPNGKQCALIKIETPYAGFTFSTGTLEVMKAEQHVGEWWVYVQKGVRKITIGHARGILREWQFPITINEGTVYVMKLKEGTSAEAAYSTAVAATTATSGFAVITSEPSGADVYIDGNWVGRTPFQKRYPMNTRLNVRCTMDKYHEDMALVTITSLKTEQHFALRQAFGSLHLTSEPSGAEVFIGAETSSRGVTPITINEVASGSVQVTLVKDMYAPIKQIIGVEDGRTTDYFVKLAPTYADITVNSLRGAAIKIDGVDKGTTTFKGPLSEGLHEVEAMLASHKTVKQQIDVVAGFPQTIALNPIPIYGTLIVTSEPFESEVYIGGKSYGKTPLIVPDMLVGEYDVEVRKAGYATAAEHVVVREGAEIEIFPKLTVGKVLAYTVNGVQFKMVEVEGGTFQMGVLSEQGSYVLDSERPIHKVTLSNYLIGQTEVTQELWNAVMNSNPSRNKALQNPVEEVSWNDCQNFIKKLNDLTGQNFRLPTEAEWEYAAKGGKRSKGYLYSGSNNIDEIAWYEENSFNKSHPVATKNPNELGIYDMSGNVWEWCQDWYGSYNGSTQTDPKGPNKGVNHVGRGGCWNIFALLCRSSFRLSIPPGNHDYDLGFRLALSSEQNYSMLTIEPDYIENGVTIGKGIAVLGDWDNNVSTPNTILYWAPVNCGYEEYGKINSKSDHRLGKLYQWGAGDSNLYQGKAREFYYDTPSSLPWYDYEAIHGSATDKWNNDRGPCPEGWRLPTSNEFRVLCTGKNGEYGLVSKATYAAQFSTYTGAEFFGANSDKTAGKGVFFPFAGYRASDDGAAYGYGSHGYFWSSSPSLSSCAYGLASHTSGLSPQDYYNRGFCFSVRCVRE